MTAYHQMNRFTLAEERQRNGEALHRFYCQVLECFISKLEKEFRYKRKVSEQQIEAIEKMVRSKINFKNREGNPSDHFASYLRMKETSEKQEIKTQLELQSNFSKDKNESLTEFVVKAEQCEKAKNESASKSISKNQTKDQEENDLDLFIKNENIGKKQRESSSQEIQPISESKKAQTKVTQAKQLSFTSLEHYQEYKEADQFQSGQQSEDSRFTQRINQRIGSAFLGTFSSYQIKRKPKEQKIFLEIDNVFVKFAHNACENFFPRITCQLSKIQKEDIKQLKS